MMPDRHIPLGPAVPDRGGQVSTCINRVRCYYGTPGVSSSSRHTQRWPTGTSFPNVSVKGPSFCEAVVMLSVIVAPLIEPEYWAACNTAPGPTNVVKDPSSLKLPIASATSVS